MLFCNSLTLLLREELASLFYSRALPSSPRPPHTLHGHPHLSTLPYSLLRGQGRQADWLSTKKYLSVLSFSLSKVEPHPPQPQTKQVFYINPIATPRFQNTTSKVRFFSQLHLPIQPARPPTRPLQSVHTTFPRHYQTLTFPWRSHIILNGVDREAELMSQK